jgi:chromosome segregation ATPase
MPILKKIPKQRNSNKSRESWKKNPHKMKKRFCIGFDIKGNKGGFTHKSKKLPRNHSVPWIVSNQNLTSSEEKSSHIHDAIDLFLERIGFEKLEEHTSNSLTTDNELQRNTEEEKDILRNELVIRNNLLDDLEQQVLQRQTGVVEKSENINLLQQESDMKNHTLHSVTLQLKEKKEEVASLQQLLQTRNGIIRDIETQLVERQTWIVENNHFTEQLSRELAQSERVTTKIKEELNRKNDALQTAMEKLERNSDEIDELRRTVLSRNKIIETIEKQMENQQLFLIKKSVDIETLQDDLKNRTEAMEKQKKQMQRFHEELGNFQMEIGEKNKIIENISKQLFENQTNFIENRIGVERLQSDMERHRQLLQETSEKLERTQQQLVMKDDELQAQGLRLQAVSIELDMIHGEIDSRNRIIEDLEQQLASEQINLVEKTQMVEHLESEVAGKKTVGKTKEKELNLLALQIENLKHELFDVTSELHERLADEESNRTLIRQKEEFIVQLEKDLDTTTEELNEKENDLALSKRELLRTENELGQLKKDSEKKWVDFILKNIELRDSKEQINELELKLDQKNTLFQNINDEMKKKTSDFQLQSQQMKETIETLTSENESRGRLIDELGKQLTSQQMTLMEKSQFADNLQSELEKRKSDLETRMVDFHDMQAVVDSLHSEISARNCIIDDMKKQLTENQTLLLKKTLNRDQLFGTLKQQDINLQSQLEKSHQDICMYRNELEKLNTERQQMMLQMDQIKQDLRKRLGELDEKCLLIGQLKSELHTTQTQCASLRNECGAVKRKLDIKTNELANLQDILKMSHSVNDQLTIKLSENNFEGELKEKTLSEKKAMPNIIIKEVPADVEPEKKLLAGDLSELKKEGTDNKMLHPPEDITWKEKLRICNEIEKCLDHTAEDHIKTKKLKNEDSK